MPFAGLIPIVYLAAVLQTWLSGRWEVSGAAPDLFVLIAIVWLTISSRGNALLVVALIGLAGDLSAPTPLGIGVALFAIVGYSISWLRQRLVLDHFAARVVCVWFAATTITLLEGWLRRFAGIAILPIPTLFERGMLVGLYTAAIAFPVFMVIGWRSNRESTDTRLVGAMR